MHNSHSLFTTILATWISVSLAGALTWCAAAPRLTGNLGALPSRMIRASLLVLSAAVLVSTPACRSLIA